MECDKNIENKNICIEKIFCYETKNFFFIIGSNSCKNKHRILKIDRRNKLKLDIECCNNNNVMTTIEMLNYLREQGFDLNKRIEPTVAFGLVGFIRFLEGYYMILIIKRRCIAMIGVHCIYKIEDTLMIYIPNEEKTATDEQRYLRIFNNVDLKSNFYFSYSYDLSNTLQYNLYTNNLNSNIINNNSSWGFGTEQTVWDINNNIKSTININELPKDDCGSSSTSIYIKPNMKFIWNEYLLSPMYNLHNDFYLYICHGFIGQAMLPIDGRNLYITLIARRSKKYAGTRFLKRGINSDGYTANEVETEQIVHDGNISSFRYGLFSSFVQLRGSVPVYWSQNSAKMTPKPAINIDINDPFFEAAGKHFNNLLGDYGSPIIVINLVKEKEKQESILYNQFKNSIEYLNQFLPKIYHIRLVDYDMAKSKKMVDNVISCLTKIAQYTFRKTGFYINKPVASAGTLNSLIQTGVVRVNCVDCLDRTNTAQCVIGIVALGHQLNSMGVLHKTELDSDTNLVKLIEELYEDHGDTLALQYGGSQLVHRIKTYRKGAPITSQSKDIMQSLSRYYSNAFSDWDKQTAINLFLGIYDTNRNDLPLIWNLNSDYELHHNFLGSDFDNRFSINDYNNLNKTTITSLSLLNHGRYRKWWSDRIALCLPRSAKELFKYTKEGMSQRDLQFVKQINNYDWFFDVHRLQENITFVEMFLFNMKKIKYYGYYKRKLNSERNHHHHHYQNNNRHKLLVVGIPIIMRSNTDESESDDDYDDEYDKIIVRFENDLHSIPLDQNDNDNNYSSSNIIDNNTTTLTRPITTSNYDINNGPSNNNNNNEKYETNINYLNKSLKNNRKLYDKYFINNNNNNININCYTNYLKMKKLNFNKMILSTTTNNDNLAEKNLLWHSSSSLPGNNNSNNKIIKYNNYFTVLDVSLRQQYSKFLFMH